MLVFACGMFLFNKAAKHIESLKVLYKLPVITHAGLVQAVRLGQKSNTRSHVFTIFKHRFFNKSETASYALTMT